MSSNFKKRAAVAAVASCLAVTPWFAEAAGLGKITVLSGLGQPLRAELEVSATREEATGMTARLAPQDAFRQAGIDYASALLDLRFSVEKRNNGQSVVKITSSKPVNEPFLDFLVELNWPAGRLVREYTFLLDPPDEFAGKPASRPVAVVDAKVVEMVSGGGGEPESRRGVASKPAPIAPKPASTPKPEASGDTHLVRQGETLRKIALETKPEGVSLEQMLVGLYKNNSDAFIGNDINRLKSGAILSIPEKSSIEAVPQSEARKIYVAQANDWNAYRQKLAAATVQGPAKADGATQAVTGKIVPKVEDKSAPAEQAKDQVKISRTEMAAQAMAAARAGEDAVAKDRALKDAQARLVQLEKNLGDLQKLVDAKSQKLAELQQQASPKKEEAKIATAPALPVSPVELPKVPELVKSEPVNPVVPVEAVKPPEPVKSEVAQTIQPSPPPEPESNFIEENLLPLAGGGGILALLAGYFMYKRRRNNGPAETTAAPGPSSLGPNTVFRMTGGQSVDTGNTPPQTGDFSQTGPGTIDTDEVDPVAEADVYMAYGRDAQAEEILIEALQKDPQRMAIHAKLLEIYANRKSLKQFETLASELYAQTGGNGPEWAKVAALGAGLDPENPLYSGHGNVAPVFDADATMIVSPNAANTALAASAGGLGQAAPSVDDTFIGLPVESAGLIDDSLALSVSDSDLGLGVTEEPVAVDDVMSLDFDLGTTKVDPTRVSAPDPVPEPEFINTIGTANANSLDFDLGVASVPLVAATVVAETDPEPLQTDAIDFDLGTNTNILSAMDDEDSGPDFSPEGTMVTRSLDALTSTFVGNEMQLASGVAPSSLAVDDQANPFASIEPDALPETESEAKAALAEDLAMSELIDTFVGDQSVVATDDVPEAEPFGDFDLNIDATESSATIVNPDILRMTTGDADEPMPNPLSVEPAPLPEINDDESLDFDVRLTDSSVLGQPMNVPSYDMGSINLDLSMDDASVKPLAEEAVSAAPELTDAQREEVSTKLDLAKAYEEMGDLEGARELLLEVAQEGSPDLVEQAHEILGRIGE